MKSDSKTELVSYNLFVKPETSGFLVASEYISENYY